ncbi:carbohydrate-binding family 9-like protein [Ectopseudomonas mendocina]|uniref:Carbohydrate-binding family 9-like protein n=1 Tax=Ectopseudomonas mendocina TaxID=300 RepID=A0ABZ2RHF2_ECTME
MQYVIRYLETLPPVTADWHASHWQTADVMSIDQFRRESSHHRPITQAKLLYSEQGVQGIFKVQDRYVRCVTTQFQDMVCNDSCVEIFLQPKPQASDGNGYISVEMSGNGTLLSYYITDAERTADGFKAFSKLTPEQGQQIRVQSTLPAVVEPEITEPTEWCLEFFIPFSVLEAYVGKLGQLSGQTWRINLFKCADQTSHPHWASWQPVPELNFHMPDTFGWVRFE